MYNSQRTLEVFGYDLESTKRRTKEQLALIGNKRPRDMQVADNCPTCGIERQIRLKQSRLNKPCSKCFHNTPEMILAKQNQNKIKSEEHKQKMKDNHWSKKGLESPFKGKNHTNETKNILAIKQQDHMFSLSDSDKKDRYIKSSCSLREVSVDTFVNFVSDEEIRIRGS